MDLSNSATKLENIELSPGVFSDAASDQKRRSSSRSIKRKRFDDEIVEYSLGIPPTQINRIGRVRTQSTSYVTTYVTSNESSPVAPTTVVVPVQQSTPIQSSVSISIPPPPPMPVPVASAVVHPSASTGNYLVTQPSAHVPSEKRKSFKTHKKAKKNRTPGSQVATKDLGRWKPVDDLALIIGIQQTNDLRMVHRAVKFSCKFTLQELQSRWFSLLYEEPISRIAVAAMRNLHPEMVEMVQSKALYTVLEEELLSTIKSTDNPTIDKFQDLLNKNSMVFYPARTAKSLQIHWQLMKQYWLLPDQSIESLPRGEHVLNFSDAEDAIHDTDLADATDEGLEIELMLADRKNKKEIKVLENELTRWTVLVDSLTGVGFTPEFDNQTLAVLRGRLVRYLMRSREITFGRCTNDATVDVDFALEGPAYKISRKQGTIKLRSNGDFFIANEGKRPIYIDGMPLMQGNKNKLNNNCVIEMAALRFIFLINFELVNAIRQESAKMNGPLN